MLRKPPDVLITTPESLYLMLTSKAREFLVDAEAVIVDEIHAVARTKRGAHLALTLERLEELAGRPLQRIGLSATQRPLEEVGRFLVGAGRECTVIDAGMRKPLDLKIHVPVENMREPDAHDVTDPAVGGMGTAAGGGDLVGDGLGEAPTTSRSIWPAIYPELLRLVQEHRSTIIFVNNRRGAERLAVRLNDLAAEESERANGGAPAANGGGGAAGAVAPEGGAPAYIARAHHGSLAREERLIVEDLLKSGRAALPRGHLVARARHRHGRRGPGDSGGVAQVGHGRSAANRPGGARRGRGLARAHLPEVPRGPARVRRCRKAHARRRHRADGGPAQPARRARTADRRHDGQRRRAEGARAPRHRQARVSVRRALARAARQRARHARRPLPVRGVRRAAAAHRLGPCGGHDPAPAAARSSSRSPTRARSRTAACTAFTCPTAAGSASWTRRWSTRLARDRRSCSERPRGGSRRSPATA